MQASISYCVSHSYLKLLVTSAAVILQALATLYVLYEPVNIQKTNKQTRKNTHYFEVHKVWFIYRLIYGSYALEQARLNNSALMNSNPPPMISGVLI